MRKQSVYQIQTRMMLRTISLFCFLFCLSATTLSAQFSVENATDPVSLANDICFGDGIRIIDVQFSGIPTAVGLFNGGENVIGLDQGIVMTTGTAQTSNLGTGVDAPSTTTASVPNGSTASSQHILPLVNDQEIFDVAVYTIRFVPERDSVRFRYVFGSDEYPDFVCSNFNDVFGFFLTDQEGNTINLAMVPGTNLPVTINSVNAGEPGTHPVVFPGFCLPPNGSLENEQFFNVAGELPVYNGFTDVFTAKAAVIPCQEYTMELVIADIGDRLWDSGIFLEANSFCAFGPLAENNIDPESPILIEGCTNNPIEFSFPNLSPDLFPLTYSISGEAINGGDFEAIPSAGEITGPGFALHLQTIADDIAEEKELIQIIIESTTCVQDTFDVYLIDQPFIAGQNQASCSEDSIPLILFPSFEGDAVDSVLLGWVERLNILWSTGDSGTQIQVPANENATFTVEYSNALNSCTDSFSLTVGDLTLEINEVLCQNEDGIEINGTLYDLTNLSGTEVIIGGGTGGCDSVVVINFTPAAEGDLNTALCSNESIVINGNVYDSNQPSGLEILDDAAADGCDSLVHINLSFIPLDTNYFFKTLCEEDIMLINGTEYGASNLSGIEVIANGNSNGCDSIIVVEIDLYPRSEVSIDTTIQEGDVFSLGGQSFQTYGNYQFSLEDSNGCDSLIDLTLKIATISETIIDSVIISVPENYCIPVDHLNEISSIETPCTSNGSVDFSLNETDFCLSYNGINPGTDTTCYILCDNFVCDTTYFIISSFTNFLEANDDFDTTDYLTPIIIPILDNDWTSATTLTDIYLVEAPSLGEAILNLDNTVSFTPNPGFCERVDSFSYAICNEYGCDTASVFVTLLDEIDLCSAVWPGDVRTDGLVNVIDFWAIGLGFGETGPMRPDATILWEPQPSPDWNNHITFIEEIDLKHGDCNGNGIVNIEDRDVVELNWGLTHDFAPDEDEFAKTTLPISLEKHTSEASNQIEISLNLGENGSIIEDFVGIGFRISYPEERVTTNGFHFLYENSWAGVLNEDMINLQRDYPGGSYIGMVRTDKTAIDGSGEIGRIILDLNPNISFKDQLLELHLTDILLLKENGLILSLEPFSLVVEEVTDTETYLPEAFKMSLFPIPARDQLQVVLSEKINRGSIFIINASGQILVQSEFQENAFQIDINNFKSGVYILQIQTKEGVQNRRFVVAH